MDFMRVVFRFLCLLAPVMGLSIFGALQVMHRLEQQWLSADLERRSQLIAASVHESILDGIATKRMAPVTRTLNRISRDERLVGALLCSQSGEKLAKSDAVPEVLQCKNAALATERNEANLFIRSGGTLLHRAALPVMEDGKSVGTLIVVHDTSYMSKRHAVTKRYVVAFLGTLSLLFFGMTLLIYRWSKGEVMRRLGGVMKGLLKADVRLIDKAIMKGELSPLARDLSKVIHELRRAKLALHEADSALMWTPARLRSDVERMFGDSQLCVIANREPYIHNKKAGKVEVLLPASGLVTAVEPIVRACSGLWISHGSGSADRETSDSNGKLLVPPGSPEYVLKRVWLSKAEEQGYYYGFSNEGLWPLCHIAHARPHFGSDDWKQYQRVNERFAQNFAEENWDDRPVVLIQDYHFALLPSMIREKRPDSIISLFWHIPWPNPEAFGICPWRKEILAGMLGADLIGFHTQFHCNNFLDTVDRFLEARVDREQFSVTIQGHTCYVKPFPISVEWPSRHAKPVEGFAAEREALLNELNLSKDIKLGVGVDRIDYTKGILERLRSVENFLDRHPEWIGKFTFVQIGAPSRTHIKRYQDLNAEVQELADRINWKFSQAEVPPIHLRLAHHNLDELFRFYRAADLCFVSSLHDGMNLVCKEYVSAKEDYDGVLVLSNFAGAAREMPEALLVNPYDLDECSEALHRALTMPMAERQERMKRLRGAVAERNVYAWAGALLSETHRISEKKHPSLLMGDEQMMEVTV